MALLSLLTPLTLSPPQPLLTVCLSLLVFVTSTLTFENTKPYWQIPLNTTDRIPLNRFDIFQPTPLTFQKILLTYTRKQYYIIPPNTLEIFQETLLVYFGVMDWSKCWPILLFCFPLLSNCSGADHTVSVHVVPRERQKTNRYPACEGGSLSPIWQLQSRMNSLSSPRSIKALSHAAILVVPQYCHFWK